MERKLMRTFAASVLALVLAAGCGGGGGGGTRVRVVDTLDPNPAAELVGIWTGTFTDQFDNYTVSMEIDADDLVRPSDPAVAFVVWGAESMGSSIGDGEFVEIGPGEYRMSYDTYDPDSGVYRDTVTGTLVVVSYDYLEGNFTTSSGTFGDFSLALTDGFLPGDTSGEHSTGFSDSATRELYYLGEAEFDGFGNLVTGPASYLTDDVTGPISAGANVWPMIDGYLELVDDEVGYYEGELFFASPDDTILLQGYLGWDFGVFAGIFTDALGSGLFTFVPAN